MRATICGTSVSVTIIDQNDKYVSNIMSNMVVVGERTIDSLAYKYDTLKNWYGVTVVTGHVASIDPVAKSVTLDGGASSDPDGHLPLSFQWEQSGGPAVTHGICNHPAVIERLEQVAQQLKIPLQHEATSATSGTDTDAIFWTRGGIASGLISLPNRYMHSPVEMVNLRDLEQIPELMAGFALSLKHGEHFKVRI